ncbi:MAG: RdgB/HAM1 family non-canonical purine NTP pyrophosphatase [Firmicutes bacterium]|nr:RdgB/HAM1 family non-canonical purine NTP pyrophosphatase [Bacillota bacterium]
MDVVVATANRHKIKEIKEIAAAAGYTDIRWHDLSEFPAYRPPEENGSTFAENAGIKAKAAAAYCGCLALADDSGLAVDALDGAPGVLSARFAAAQGEDHNDRANNDKLLSLLRGLPAEARGAAFHCVAAVARPDGFCRWVEGSCPGVIAEAAAGSSGFGYDPLFYLPQFGCTMAELDEAGKNRISHRGQAMRLALPLLLAVARGEETADAP